MYDGLWWNFNYYILQALYVPNGYLPNQNWAKVQNTASGCIFMKNEIWCTECETPRLIDFLEIP